MSRLTIIAALLFATFPANAGLIQLDIGGSFDPLSPWHGPNSGTNTFTASFIIDTMASETQFNSWIDRNGIPCVGQFTTSFSTRVLGVDIDGTPTSISGAASGGGYGDSTNCGPDGSQRFLGSMGFQSDDWVIAMLNWDPTFSATLEELSTGDFLSTLLLSSTKEQSLLRFTSEMGTGYGTISSISFYQVPEPGTLGLLSIGLLATIAARRRVTPQKS